MQAVEERLGICEVGEAGKARLEQPIDSRKARRLEAKICVLAT
jgi:hypothetical protein